MRIENDIKLDYSDVLLRPKRSTLGSRSEVILEREFVFKNYESSDKIHYSGIPIMAANMDGVATFEMADELARLGLFTCLVKTYSVEDLVNFFNIESYHRTQSVAMSIGITDTDFEKFKTVYNQVGHKLKYVCVDVANGYSEKFVDFIKKLKEHYPYVVIIAGNVVTGEMVEELLIAGASIAKVGIGPGRFCFHEDVEIKTKHGHKKIKDINIGDIVLTHNNNYKKVTNKFENKTTELLTINGITCTPDHKFYVIDKNKKDLVNETNYTKFAYWLEAKYIENDKHLLISM